MKYAFATSLPPFTKYAHTRGSRPCSVHVHLQYNALHDSGFSCACFLLRQLPSLTLHPLPAFLSLFLLDSQPLLSSLRTKTVSLDGPFSKLLSQTLADRQHSSLVVILFQAIPCSHVWQHPKQTNKIKHVFAGIPSHAM